MIEDGTHKLGVGLTPVKNTKHAAMLLTLGVPFADPDEKDLIRNIYSEERPYKPGMPGEITYLIGAENADGVKALDLIAAYQEAKADQQLDALVDEIEAANPALGKRLRALLPKALAVHARGFYENRENILDLWKRARPMVLIRKSETSFCIIPRDASPELRKRFGV